MSAKHFRLAGALVLFAAALPALAASTARPRVVVEQLARTKLLQPAANAGAAQAKELIPNASRAYPAGCFSDTQPSVAGNIEPLPVTPSGPLYGGAVTLYAYNTQLVNHDTTENVTITIWRLPCSSSGDKTGYNPDGGAVAATLIRIQRSAASNGTTLIYPTFPAIRIAQGSIGFDDANFRDYARVVAEPNTVIADTNIDAPVISSTTYVLENYPYSGASVFAFNQSFQIRFDNGYTDTSGNPIGQTVFSIPAYNPTASSYPAASQPLPINGYLSGSWYDPTHSGEGILTQVYDNDGKTRIFAATWYTFDQAGIPFWLVASATFSVGATSIPNMAVGYRTGGGFAGSFTPPAPQQNWGTMTVSFPNCQKMTFSYNGAATAVNGGPAGSGTKTFTRLGSINSLACQ
ncbi:MAG: hypothetical protein ABI846_11825 [Rudaea sp.]